MFSALDDRYKNDLKELQKYFGEDAYIKEKVVVEKKYLALICSLQNIDFHINNAFMREEPDLSRIKEIENVIRHDTKAIEVYLQECLRTHLLDQYIPMVHWGLTSWDVISLASTHLLQQSIQNVVLKKLSKVLEKLGDFANNENVLLGRTHGQPATPIQVKDFFHFYISRLLRQCQKLNQSTNELTVKFGGTVGKLQIHHTFLSDELIEQKFADWIQKEFHGLQRSPYTTQIDAYDSWIGLFQDMQLICGILLDFVKNVWGYISLDLLKQKVINQEVGSSVMPHKVNPIQWENAEGNLKLAIGFFQTLCNSLVESRFQRDMSDSTIIRNIGVPIAHMYLALVMVVRGLDRLDFNQETAIQELNQHYEVLTEVIQHVFRQHNIENAYDIMKEYSRGQSMNQDQYLEFIGKLEERFQDKNIRWDMLKRWTPEDYGKVKIRYE